MFAEAEIALTRHGNGAEMEIRISVRNLVEFILRSGDIDNRRSAASDNAMQEGSRLHRLLQSRMGTEYAPEVFLRHVWETDAYTIVVEGRADGVITEPGNVVTVDEIKTTYREVEHIKAPVPVHLAQAKVYAAIYGMQNGQERMRIRMTYCNVETEELKYFFEEETTEELREWFESLLGQYRKWADYEYEWGQKRQASIEKLEFPFPYREGQRELVSYVYQSIYHKRKLFVEAPTGVGKTISTIFPAIKAMGKNMGDKLFYLTAKTITRTVAEDTFSLLRRQGLLFKSVVLTAKDKICFMEETECNPLHCPYAKGHYDRINEAVYDLLLHADSFTREKIEEYAHKHRVCPFEFCLDVSLFADGIIGDYNYLFDPHVALKRFFSEGAERQYLFLVDEAHNLLERGREMYSAVLYKEAFADLKKKIAEAQKALMIPAAEMSASERGRIREYGPKLVRQLEKCNKQLLLLKRECEDCCVLDQMDSFVQTLNRLEEGLNAYLEENDDNPVRKDILNFYFEITHFLEIYEQLDDSYVKYSLLQEDGRFLVKLFCVNPALNLQERMAKGRSTILFSATLLPIQYYKKLLGGTAEDYEVYAKSIFDPAKRAIYIGSDVTSRYSRRSEGEYFNIARYIYEIVKNRHGNYMVFFPSHSFLTQVLDCFCRNFQDEQTDCVVQEEFMDETEREQFLKRFEGNPECSFQEIHMEIALEEERNLIGFCVLGGIFGEGIDLKRDSLIGVIVVGTGIPQVCSERELLKQFFDARGENGFDYAYRFPGMNKVLQAAGRVIRTSEDVGVIALLDERFCQPSYRRLFPREWEELQTVTADTVSKRIERFWDEWL